MGNESGSPFDLEEKLKTYQKREKVDDERFGKVTIYNHKYDNNKLIMVKKRWTNTPEETEQLTNFIESRRTNNHRNLAKYPIYHLNPPRLTFYVREKED